MRKNASSSKNGFAPTFASPYRGKKPGPDQKAVGEHRRASAANASRLRAQARRFNATRG